MSLPALLAQDVLAAAPSLLGWHLVRDGLRARIVEVEAYRAEDDPACHAFRKTAMKNMAMFGPAGHAYVYFSYGCHWMLNVVAHAPGDAAAILIRAAEPIQGQEMFHDRRPKARRDRDLLSGPGKLAAAFAIDASDNGTDLLDPQPRLGLLKLEAPDIPAVRIVAGPRVGIALGKGHKFPWRFADADRLQWVSRPLTF